MFVCCFVVLLNMSSNNSSLFTWCCIAPTECDAISHLHLASLPNGILYRYSEVLVIRVELLTSVHIRGLLLHWFTR